MTIFVVIEGTVTEVAIVGVRRFLSYLDGQFSSYTVEFGQLKANEEICDSARCALQYI